MKIVTMQEIAEECGKSVTTVSNVLNSKGKFSAETRRAVLESAHRLGYVTDFSAYEEKVLAIALGKGIDGDVGKRVIREISSIAVSKGVVPQLLSSDEQYPYLLVVGSIDERTREDYSRRTERVAVISDTGDIPMGIQTTERSLIETLRTLRIQNPLILYDEVRTMADFSLLSGFDSFCTKGLKGERLLEAIEEFGSRPLVILCPHRPEEIFCAIRKRDVQGLTILVEYLLDVSIQDFGTRYLRFDIYSRELLEAVIAQLTGDVCDLETCRGRSSVTLVGGI